MTVPPFGFGTAPILGRLNRHQGLHALETAYSVGIRHFDTARSYGWGECEAVLGEFLAGHPRASYTLVSKCGLVPARRTNALSVAKKLARQVVTWLPAARGIVRRFASASQFSPVATYEVDALRSSVETSLRELRTSYLDILILHNFEPGRPGLDEVIALFRELREQGCIKRFGFSLYGDLNVGLEYLASHDVLTEGVVQVPVTDQLLELQPRWRAVNFIAHSPFKYLETRGVAGDTAALRGILTSLAGAARCEALVTSMFSEQHITQNVAVQRATRDEFTALHETFGA